jgi:hypothetical protein
MRYCPIDEILEALAPLCGTRLMSARIKVAGMSIEVRIKAY